MKKAKNLKVNFKKIIVGGLVVSLFSSVALAIGLGVVANSYQKNYELIVNSTDKDNNLMSRIDTWAKDKKIGYATFSGLGAFSDIWIFSGYNKQTKKFEEQTEFNAATDNKGHAYEVSSFVGNIAWQPPGKVTNPNGTTTTITKSNTTPLVHAHTVLGESDGDNHTAIAGHVGNNFAIVGVTFQLHITVIYKSKHYYDSGFNLQKY